MLQGVARLPAAQRRLIGVFHQVKTPAHGQQRVKTHAGCQKRQILNGAGMDKVGLQVGKQAPELALLPGQVFQLERAANTLPGHFGDAFGSLGFAPKQAQGIDFVAAFSERR